MSHDNLLDGGDAPRLRMLGLEVLVPPGWECRMRQASDFEVGAVALPVIHAATVPLSSDRADYGGGVVERLTDEDVFVAMIEFGDEAVGSKLYPHRYDMPRVDQAMFHPFRLQRRIQGQAGTQVFFTLGGRAFCLYVVIGSYRRRLGLSAKANQLISQISVHSQ